MGKERIAYKSKLIRDYLNSTGKAIYIPKAVIDTKWYEEISEERKEDDDDLKYGYDYFHGNRLPTVECTGFGNTLCFLKYEGRFFRSDPMCVKDQLNFFADEYTLACNDYDENPVRDYEILFTENDKYQVMNLVPTRYGDKWVYPNTEDCRVEMGFIFTYLKKDNLEGTEFEGLDEDIFIIEPEPGAYPVHIETTHFDYNEDGELEWRDDDE